MEWADVRDYDINRLEYELIFNWISHEIQSIQISRQYSSISYQNHLNASLGWCSFIQKWSTEQNNTLRVSVHSPLESGIRS